MFVTVYQEKIYIFCKIRLDGTVRNLKQCQPETRETKKDKSRHYYISSIAWRFHLYRPVWNLVSVFLSFIVSPVSSWISLWAFTSVAVSSLSLHSLRCCGFSFFFGGKSVSLIISSFFGWKSVSLINQFLATNGCAACSTVMTLVIPEPRPLSIDYTTPTKPAVLSCVCIILTCLGSFRKEVKFCIRHCIHKSSL